MTSRLRPGGPTVAVRRGGDEIGVEGERTSVDGGVNSDDGGEGPLTNASKDGPALRRSLKLLRWRWD